MRLGFILSGGGMRVSDMSALAETAEESGIETIHVVESLRSGPVPLAAIAARTRKATLGTYVLNAHARSPWMTGLEALDLDDVSGGRLLLGVGSGNRVTNERYQGIPVTRPLAKMRDYVHVLRRVTTAQPGQLVEYSGDVHSTHDWRQHRAPTRAAIPIYLAATSPKMTALAAEVADGVALGTIVSAQYVGRTGEACRRLAGPQFGVIATAFVAVDADRARARAAARRAVVSLYAAKPHPHYDALLRQQGFGDVADAIIASLAGGDLQQADRAVTDELIDNLAIAGTPLDCLRRLACYAAVADELVLLNVSAMNFLTPESSVDAGGLIRSFDPLFELAREYSSTRHQTRPK